MISALVVTQNSYRENRDTASRGKRAGAGERCKRPAIDASGYAGRWNVISRAIGQGRCGACKVGVRLDRTYAGPKRPTSIYGNGRAAI